MKEYTKKEAEKLIHDYFLNEKLDKEQTRKIKKLAMSVAGLLGK